MKKIMLVGLCIVLLTGCFGGTKTLTCTKTETDIWEMDMKIAMDFRNDEATFINMDIKLTLDAEYAEFVDMFMESLEEEFEELKKQGWEVKMDSSGTVITINFKADVDKLQDATNDFFDMDLTKGFEANKAEAEAEGFECK